MADQPISPESATVTDSGLFVRNATGLVRGMSQRASVALNLIPGHPIQTLAAVMFAFLALFPGANPYLALLIVLPMTLSFSYAFGLLTQMIPRSGGDYMIVSRVLGPLLGFISSFCMTMAGLLSNAFFGIAFVTSALGPSFVMIGTIGHHQSLIDFGNKISNMQGHRGWVFFLGSAMIVLACLIHLAGWRWMIRFLSILFWVVTGGLLLAVATFLFTGKSSFAKNFDSFAGPGEYQATIDRAVKAGTQVSPSFSFGQTIILVAGLATVSIYCYWSTFVGGELRQASTLKTANNMARAGLAGLSLVAVFAFIILHSAGSQFMIAANGGGLKAGFPFAPSFMFLSAASVGNTLFAIVIAICYCVFWPLITWLSLLQPTRMLFAYAFDGMLPKIFASTTRSGAPWVSVIVSGAGSIAVLGWATGSASFFKALAYATLIQLIAMGLVGLSALVVAYRKPELYRASASQRQIAGIPLTTIAGAGAIISCVFLWIVFLSEPKLGIADRSGFFVWAIGTIVAGALFYAIAYSVRKGQGVNVNRAFAEIPPE
jgi:APA family basic amino acid/polyamine antiporter